MGERARVRLIRAAQSERAARDLPPTRRDRRSERGPKYPRRVLMELAARIVGPGLRADAARALPPRASRPTRRGRASRRAYGAGRPSNGGAGFEWLFWEVEEARDRGVPGRLRPRCGGFRSPAPNRRFPAIDDARKRRAGIRPGGRYALHVGDDAVTLTYPNGRVRTPVRAHGGPRRDDGASSSPRSAIVTLVDALDPLAAPAVDRGTVVSDAARDLARRLYRMAGRSSPRPPRRSASFTPWSRSWRRRRGTTSRKRTSTTRRSFASGCATPWAARKPRRARAGPLRRECRARQGWPHRGRPTTARSDQRGQDHRNRFAAGHNYRLPQLPQYLPRLPRSLPGAFDRSGDRAFRAAHGNRQRLRRGRDRSRGRFRDTGRRAGRRGRSPRPAPGGAGGRDQGPQPQRACASPAPGRRERRSAAAPPLLPPGGVLRPGAEPAFPSPAPPGGSGRAGGGYRIRTGPRLSRPHLDPGEGGGPPAAGGEGVPLRTAPDRRRGWRGRRQGPLRQGRRGRR